MSTPNLESSAAAPIDKGLSTPFSGANHPFAYNGDKAPVLIAQAQVPKAIGEGGGQPGGGGNPNPKPVGEGGGNKGGTTTTIDNTTTVTDNQKQQQQQKQNQNQDQTAIGEGGKGGQGGQGGQGGKGGSANSDSTATGGNATAKGGTAKSSSIGEGGIGEGGTGGTGTGGTATGGANNLNEVSNFSIPRETVPVIPGTFTPEACVNGTSLGGATPWAGFNFTHQKPDPGCEARNNRALEYQKQNLDNNLQFQKDVHKDNVLLDQQSIQGQVDAAKAKAEADKVAAEARAKVAMRAIDCDNMLKMSAEARAGYGNLTDLGNQARAGNPAAAQLFNSESAYPPAFAMGSLQAMEACGYKVDTANLGMKLAVPAPVEKAPEPPVKRVVTHRPPTPKDCIDHPTALRAFLAEYPTIDWTAPDKAEMTKFFKDNPTLKKSDVEKKQLGEK